ncbi:MAG: hypothetical protein ACI92G_003323 [Candidatus Pelagisphaera sp.]
MDVFDCMSEEFAKDLFLFADNQPLPMLRYESMLRGIALMESSHWRTRDYIEENRLDREIFLPRNVWSKMCNLDSFHKWPYSLANFCKIVSPFTGHYMALWGRIDMGHLEPRAVACFYERIFSEGVPDDVDDFLFKEFDLGDRIEEYRIDLLGAYDRLVECVPIRYRVKTPNRMGEIGILHDGNIVNYDTVTYQGRINALHGMGVLERLERAVSNDESVRIFEIGGGHCYMGYALQSILRCKVQVILVDLPSSLVNGYVYLTGLFGADKVQIVSEGTYEIEDKPFVLVPNYLLPKLENQSLKLDLVLNAISLNEMNAPQNEYYLDFIERHSKTGAIFHMEGGAQYLKTHVDSLGIAKRKFPNHRIFSGKEVNGVNVHFPLNTFFETGEPSA